MTPSSFPAAVVRAALCVCAVALFARAGEAEQDAAAKGQDVVFLEAEHFADLGGWVVDQQFMRQMGSPYLLAHGIGRPVADAVTKAVFPRPGRYRLFVRTRDWAPPHGPGLFTVKVDGWESNVLGAEGDIRAGIRGGSWHWEDCGEVEVSGEADVRLHDLTGFEGRVDALCFISGGGRPERPALAVAEGPSYDFVVVGGGFAGMC
ncbi:MAG: hypothetical protein IJ829_04595, partial [Kiritimatiellae bacterium]|nr:hypothetical protein [Kiritimatiellia bacterium]